MRTLLIAPAVFSSEGGIERMMRLYLKALCETEREGDEVVLASLNDSEFPVERMACYSNERLAGTIAGNRRHLRFVARCLLQALTCDRVIAGHFHLMRIVHLARRLRPRLQAFIVAHGTEVWRPWTRQEQRLAQADMRFLAVSNYTKRQILGHCPGVHDHKVMVVPNSLDPMLARAPDVPVQRDPNLVLVVSRLSTSDNYKGVDHLIEALPIIRRNLPKTRLRIVGCGDDELRLRALAERHAPGAVEFAGFVPDEAMPVEYARAGLFALPSRDEGFGLVYLEAFHQGTPCLAASSGAAPELITVETGRCAVYGDIPNLAETCCGALQISWDETRIRARAADFDFTSFKRRLALNLDSISPTHA